MTVVKVDAIDNKGTPLLNVTVLSGEHAKQVKYLTRSTSEIISDGVPVATRRQFAISPGPAVPFIH